MKFYISASLCFLLSFKIITVHAQSLPESNDLSKYVNPFVGTQGDGNTFPGAVAPFGMMQISPDTDINSWEAASGYEYTDSVCYGFSLTHMNGTGIPDLGDFLFVPSTGKVKFVPGTKQNPDSGYITRFSHDKESASPGFYSAFLPKHKIQAEFTATERAGILKFTFPASDSSNIMIDLAHVLQWKILASSVRIENDSVITGYHLVRGWAKERYIYFAAIFSQKSASTGIISNGKKVMYNTRRFTSKNESFGTNLQVFKTFKTTDKQSVMVKVGISAVSASNALMNLKQEIPHSDFQRVVNETRQKWNTELKKITIEGSKIQKETFYTSMYHAFLTPVIYQDVNGEYRGFDKNIHRVTDFTNYTIFSVWDTYRATHPLFNLIQAQRNTDMIKSMLKHYDESVDHMLPIWSFYSNETWCMIGYHSVSVIADAYLKGLRNFDYEKAYEAIKATAMNPDYDNVQKYSNIGYVPCDLENESVSKTLEYAYDDYCVALLAKALNKESDYNYFLKRAMAYKNIYDKSTSFMRGKDSKGNWRVPFHPKSYEDSQDITEATSWQYTWYVPQDVQGLINLMGGKTKFVSKLDSLFLIKSDEEKGTEDIHGIIGQYWHGNEPCHHIAFLYDYAGQPWKTQEKVHQIMKTQYGNTPNSLCGNDDCGQMSSWYIFNALGFYPVCPVNNYFVIGSPSVNQATVHLSNGSTLVMKANNLSDKNIYIQSMVLNKKNWDNTYIPFDELKNGGEIIFIMGPKPNKNWGVSNTSKPESISKEITF